MATATMKDRFAGMIVEKTELNSLSSTGKAVINFTVAKTEEVIAGIKEQIEARIVLFGSLAERANRELDAGKVIMFTNVQKNPRIFTTEKGTEVETVDLVARGYTILNKSQYDKSKADIDAISFGAKDLIFTEEDRAKALKQTGAVKTTGPVT
jgi:single-stranded DNA-binding protein